MAGGSSGSRVGAVCTRTWCFAKRRCLSCFLGGNQSAAMRTLARHLLVLSCALLLLAGSNAAVARPETGTKKAVFLAGASSADVTPPVRTAATDAAFVPLCGPDAATVQSSWPGERPFAYTEPYFDISGANPYAPG